MIYGLRYSNAIGAIDFSIASGFVVEEATAYGAQEVGFDTTRSNREIGETLQHQSVNPKTLTIRGTILGASASSTPPVIISLIRSGLSSAIFRTKAAASSGVVAS